MSLDFPSSPGVQEQPAPPPVAARPTPPAPQIDYNNAWKQVGEVPDAYWKQREVMDKVQGWADTLVESATMGEGAVRIALDEALSWGAYQVVQSRVKKELAFCDEPRFCNSLIDASTNVMTNLKGGLSGAVERVKEIADYKKAIGRKIDELEKMIRDFGSDFKARMEQRIP